MYRAVQLPPLPPTPKDPVLDLRHGAIDVERNLVVRFIASDRDFRRFGWLFQHGDDLVPFEVSEPHVDEDGQRFLEIGLESFGSSINVGSQIGVGHYAFPDADQQREWTLLAVEGVLVYNSERYVVGRYSNRIPRMTALGRVWVVEDFGYTMEGIRNSIRSD